MTLSELLNRRQPALCERWLDAILRDYGPVTAARWRQERDPFANPVGHALSTGLPEILEAVVAGQGLGERALAALQEIVRVRSVQDFTPSRSVSFVCLLRRAVRDELAAELAGGEHAAELADLDGRVEQLALLAFDVYVGLREELFRIRQEELRRSVASILRRWNGGAVPDAASDDLVRLSSPPDGGVRR